MLTHVIMLHTFLILNTSQLKPSPRAELFSFEINVPCMGGYWTSSFAILFFTAYFMVFIGIIYFALNFIFGKLSTVGTFPIHFDGLHGRVCFINVAPPGIPPSPPPTHINCNLEAWS